MIDDQECPKSGKHLDLQASQMKKSECAVQKIMKAISHFTNLWNIVDKAKSYCLAYGTLVSEEIEKDILWADELAKTLKNTFVQERLKHGHEKHFFRSRHTTEVKDYGRCQQNSFFNNLTRRDNSVSETTRLDIYALGEIVDAKCSNRFRSTSIIFIFSCSSLSRHS